MAIIPQKTLFSWQDIEKTGEIKRLEHALNNLPDQKLMISLEKHRRNGRDDYPIRAVWNSVIAGTVFGHETIESLRRELKRNPCLLEMCGFDVFKGEEAVPPPWVYTRFMKLLLKQSQLVYQMFDDLVDECSKLLPEYGKHLAIDGKAIPSFAIQPGKISGDERGDHDADWGKHRYSGVNKDGTFWEKIKKWFGYKVHLLVDSTYELPIAFTVTKASVNEMPVAHELLEKTKGRHSELLKSSEYLTGDRGLDDGKLIKKLWDAYKIKPVIDIRNLWKDHDSTKLVPGQVNIVYNYSGTVSCHCPKQKDKIREMAFGGFEKDRDALKYRCPAKHYGYECKGMSECPVNTAVRIPLDIDRRVFTPVARSSYKWKTLYKKRTAVERVNSRLDVSFGFEHHTIRGHKKMSMRVNLALCIMLALAVGWTKEKKPELIRSLVKTA